jgi:hypothetical protein
MIIQPDGIWTHFCTEVHTYLNTLSWQQDSTCIYFMTPNISQIRHLWRSVSADSCRM